MRWLARPLWENIPFPERWPPGGRTNRIWRGQKILPALRRRRSPRCRHCRKQRWPYGGRNAAALLYAPGRQGKAVNILKVKPLTDLDKCSGCGLCAALCPMGSIDPVDVSQVKGYLHQMLCLCEKVSHRGKVLHGPGLSVSPARTGRRLCPPGSGGNVSVIHWATGPAAAPQGLLICRFIFSPIPWFWHKRHLLHP